MTVENKIFIKEVQSRGELREFIRLPRRLYSDKNSHYVMPLEAHVKTMIGKLGTPKKHLLLAYKNGEPVARLGIKVHTVGEETRLHFGFFECDFKHPEAAKELFSKAHSMYPELELMGPFNFRQEDPYIGVLVEGHELEPYFMMSFNPKEYDLILKNAGLEKVMDLYTYILNKENGCPDLILKNSSKARKELNLTFRSVNPKKLREEARIIAGIFNEALRDNWGFEEFLESQIDEMVLMFKFFVDPRIVIYAMHEGQEIGCLLMIPNYNHVIKPSHGRVDFGLIRRYLGRAESTDSIRGYALGVLKKYQGHGIGSALVEEMFNVCDTLPYKFCEISWVLSNNGPMNELSKAMGGKQNKVYRVYKGGPNRGFHN